MPKQYTQVVDGDDATRGAKADTAITDATTTNTEMSFIKGLVKILADIWDSGNHRIKTDGSGVTQPVSGSVSVSNFPGTQPVSAASLPLPSGASTAAKQPALGTAGSASADVLSVQGVASMTALKTDGSGVTQPVSGTFWQATQPVSGTVSITSNSAVNVAQVAGTTTDVNSGSKSAGTQRIVIATDQPQLTNALKVDGSGVTQPVSGTITANAGTGNFNVAATTGGSTPSHTISANTTNATSTKGSAGQIYGFCISNANAAARYFKLYNKATAPTVGSDTPVMTVQIPASSTVARAFPVGLAFSTGIAWAVTTGITNADTGAVGTSDLSIDIDWI